MLIPDMEPMAGLRGELRWREPLARYTSWRVGGPAERLYRAADLDDLRGFLGRLPTDAPVFWLGLGSNLLIRDGGIRGAVVVTQGVLQRLELTGPRTLRVEAGVPCAKVARFSTRHELAGVEFLAGIPGLMGGALAMNAGAWGEDTWSWVERVETLDRRGQCHWRTPADYRIDYRSVEGQTDEWFIAAHLRLMPGNGERSRAYIRDLLARRTHAQPVGVPSCGSVFRNPPGDFAARLIETADLKGARFGAAQVSCKHANFIINTGNARAADLEALIEQVKTKVAQVHGITLVPEVRIVGEQS